MGEAGREKVQFTTGLLIGIGETRQERIEALVAIRDLHRRYGHIQEVIIQNFRAKPDTRMADHPEPPLEEHLWTIAAARLIPGAAMSIQAPPNQPRRADLEDLLDRKRGAKVKRVSVGQELGGRRIMKKKKSKQK